MRRREALQALLAGAAVARPRATLESFFEGQPGAGILLEIAAKRVRGLYRPDIAAQELVPPGSTVKPVVLSALMRLNRLAPEERFACPGVLIVGGRSLPCSHPPLTEQVTVSTALTYSCNCFAAHFAQRFRAGELAAALERAGFTAKPGLFGPEEAAGRVRAAATPESNQLQALGEEGVAASAAALAMVYRRLATDAPPAIRHGLEDAVEFGTAQRARVAGLKVAGKTGSAGASNPSGRIAWFAGFAPSRAPEVVVVVMLHARSGGADAAPVAGRILEAYHAGRL